MEAPELKLENLYERNPKSKTTEVLKSKGQFQDTVARMVIKLQEHLQT
ncbi:hypothetical protein OAC51_03970 [Flavobacteriaceae bacterium]|nr:hypothetical protein [Flavobacteriaceae bacterium]